MARSAYDYEFTSESARLPYAALVCLLYLGAFRIGEALRLVAEQFKRKNSLLKREFIVIENALVEKSGGKVRNVAIFPGDPMAEVLQAHLSRLQPKDPLFQFSGMTAWRVIGRASGGEAWPHWFKAQRDRFLANAFNPEERRRIVGWSTSEYKPGQSFRSVEERYAGLNWMFYADRLALLTESYWESEPIPTELRGWLDSLPIIPTTATTS